MIQGIWHSSCNWTDACTPNRDMYKEMNRMNVFKRFSDIVSSNINSALDRMEDPAKMIALMIDKMEETAIEVRSSIAHKSAELSTIERQCHEAGRSIERWSDRARLAIAKGREDLAREAIAEKKTLEAQAATLKENAETLRTIIESLKQQLEQVEEKLGEMKAKRADLASRAEAAKEKKRTNQVLAEAGTEDFARRFEELQARIERWEAEARVCTSSNASKSARQTFEEMERDKAIEDELAALKASMAATEGNTL